MSYIILRGHWCGVIVLNVHAPTKETTDDVKDSFYEELERVFHNFPKYHMKILLGDFNSKVGREDIFKPTIGNESLHQVSNDNGVVHFGTFENLIAKNTMLSHRNFHKFTWTSPDGKSYNQIGHILIGDGIQVYLMSERSGEQTVILTTILWWQKLGRDWQ
jgi:hypothetical protein